MLTLLTLPVRPEAELKASTQQILKRRPDLLSAVLSMQIVMLISGIPAKELRHTRVAQQWIEEGRQDGEARGRVAEAASMALRQLNRRCGPLSDATTACIQALPLEQLELLTESLLDFNGPANLAACLAEHSG